MSVCSSASLITLVAFVPGASVFSGADDSFVCGFLRLAAGAGAGCNLMVAWGNGFAALDGVTASGLTDSVLTGTSPAGTGAGTTAAGGGMGILEAGAEGTVGCPDVDASDVDVPGGLSGPGAIGGFDNPGGLKGANAEGGAGGAPVGAATPGGLSGAGEEGAAPRGVPMVLITPEAIGAPEATGLGGSFKGGSLTGASVAGDVGEFSEEESLTCRFG